MLGALIRKDVRICRLPLVSGVVLLLAPFGMSAAMISNMPLWSEATPASAWAVLLATGCYFSVMCSQATLAMLSGSLIAAERSDRSAEFLAYLPPSRLQVLGSKLIVLVGCALVIWCGNLVVALFANWLDGESQSAWSMTADLVAWQRLAAIGMAAVGAGWCASAGLGNTGPPVALAFSAPMGLLGCLLLVQYLTNWPIDFEFASVYFKICWVTGACLFLAGCSYFLRRIEP